MPNYNREWEVVERFGKLKVVRCRGKRKECVEMLRLMTERGWSVSIRVCAFQEVEHREKRLA